MISPHNAIGASAFGQDGGFLVAEGLAAIIVFAPDEPVEDDDEDDDAVDGGDVVHV